MDDVLKVLAEPEPELKPFDDFFVGGGSAAQMRRPAVSDFSDLIVKSNAPVVVVHPDLDRFADDVADDFDYREVFVAGKRRAYQVFDYLKIKSGGLSTPMTEDELVFGNDDRYLLEGLRTCVTDSATLLAIAELSAWREQQVTAVRFLPRCECPLCKTLAGLLVSVDRALALFGQGAGITHKRCACGFAPVIDRRRSYGALDAWLNAEEFMAGSKTVFGAPRELWGRLEPLVGGIKQDAIEFLDLEHYTKEAGCVVREDDGVLLVHNGYLYGRDAVDYLTAYLGMSVLKCGAAQGAAFYYKGHRVIQSQGFYWDTETKERVI